MQNMIPLEKAEQIILEIPVYPGREKIPLRASTGRVLAEPIVSPINMPPFDKSAMDGYALKSDDTCGEYTIIEVIPAGSIPGKEIHTGECAKIMTGAMVPPGADRVVMVEVTEENNGKMRLTGTDPHRNICYMGEDLKTGETVLEPGILIRPQETAVIASMGKADVFVYKAPVVGIIATGSELVVPGNPLGKGQIYNSNSYSLAAQVEKTGCTVILHGVAVDTEDDISTAVASLEKSCDMVLLSGGVSMGDYDLVPGILKKRGVTMHFEKVAVKPGKPTLFGTKGNTFYFGVPGNPVSTFVIFEILIKPLMYRMMSHTYAPLVVKSRLAHPVKRKRTARTAYIPVIYSRGEVRGIDYHGSAHIHALTQANGLISISRGVHEIPAGSEVEVRII
jgi:molybdopterin molybdotransferase